VEQLPCDGGQRAGPRMAEVDALLARFRSGRTRAQRRYAEFVAAGVGAPSLWLGLRGQIYLGDERFVRRMQTRLDAKAGEGINVPKAQRRALAPALPSIAARRKDRNQAVLAAHETCQYSYQQIAERFGIHSMSVGPIVRAGQAARGTSEGKRRG